MFVQVFFALPSQESAHLRPGCCSLAHIFSDHQFAGKRWVLVPPLAAQWVGDSALETA